MRLLRIFLAEGAATLLKVFAIGLYSAWAFKLGLIDTDTNPLFALTMVLLSIYGLWVVVQKASEYLVRIIERNSGADAVPKGLTVSSVVSAFHPLQTLAKRERRARTRFC